MILYNSVIMIRHLKAIHMELYEEFKSGKGGTLKAEEEEEEEGISK